MSQMLTVADASAVLLVLVGVAVLVILCCAALIWARTHFAPHADCKKELSAFRGMLEEVMIRQKALVKRKSGEAGGRPPARSVEVPAETAEISSSTSGRLSDEELERAAGARLQGMLNGRNA